MDKPHEDKHISEVGRGFDTFENAREYVARMGTHYERRHGLGVTGHCLVLDEEDFKVMFRESSDRRNCLIVFFKASTVGGHWFFWIPSETQARNFGGIYEIYLGIEKANARVAQARETGNGVSLL
jgi:hypothetical protein